MTVCISFFFSSRRRHTRCLSDWSSDVCSSDLLEEVCPHLVEHLDWQTLGVGSSLQHQRRNRRNKDGSRDPRSEERRVGKECRSRWAAEDEKKKEASASDQRTRTVVTNRAKC